VQKIVSQHGKIMIGWDEVLRPDLPQDIVVQTWRGQESLAQAAKQGYRGLLSYGYYLDLMWPASRHYAVDPLNDAAANLSPDEKQRILGGEACMWSEYVSPENIDSRIWPRLAAIAERLWSSQNVTDVNSMYQRLEATSRWLDWPGLTHDSSYEPMLRRIAGSDDIAGLRTLADVVEPVKDYVREETAPVVPTSLVPLNRLVDAVRPESTLARQFADFVDGYTAAGGKDADRGRLIKTFLLTPKPNPFLYQSFLVREADQLATNLSRVASAGLQAVDYLERGQRPPDAWIAQQASLLEEAGKPQAQLLLMIVPPVQKLVQTAAGQSMVPAGK
jgi:hexosaminidase